MAGAYDNFGCCGLVQGFCGLVQALLDPRSGGGRGLSSSQFGRTRSPWDVEIRSDLSPVAWNSPDLRSRSSQAGRTWSSRDVSDRNSSTVARNSTTQQRSNGSGTSNGHSAQISHPLAPTVSGARASSATRVQSGTSNAHTAQISHPVAPTVSAPRAQAAAGAGRGTGNAHTAQISHSLAPTVSGARASSATRVQSGTSNAHTAQISQPVAPTVSAPRAQPAAGAGRGTSNTLTALITHPVEPTVSAARSYSVARTGTGTSNAHTSQITHPVEPTVGATRACSAARIGTGTSSTHTSQTTRPLEQTVRAPRVYPAVGAGRDFFFREYAKAVGAGRDSNSTAQQNGMAGGIEDDDDDDCVIVAEKGQVACRDFPHARHLCSNMPFGTTSHKKHCTMCYCFVCDAPAPCSYWGKGLSVDDHCHATDKETKWNTLRQAFKQRSNGSGTSNGHSAQISHPLAPTVSGARASSATRVQSGTSNAHTAQISHPVAPTVTAPRAQPAAGAGRGTSNAQTAQTSHSLALTVSGPRASSATRVESGRNNGYSAQVTHLIDPTVSAPRTNPVAGAGRGTSNAHTSQTTRPVEQTFRAPRVYPAARAGRDSSNAHSAPEGATVYVGNLPGRIDNETLKLTFQHAGVILFSKVIYDRETGQSRGFGYITMNTVQEAETAVRMYNGSMVYGRPLTVNVTAPRGGARVDTARSQSVSPFKIFVCNLPTQVDRPRLEELFSKHGKVVDARVIYERRGEDWCSRGFGFVTMSTEEESRNAIRALNKQVLEGQALRVKVARDMRPEQGCPSHSNQIPLQNSAGQNQNTHTPTSVRASLNVAPTVSATRDRSGTSNSHAAQVTHRRDPTVNSPRA